MPPLVLAAVLVFAFVRVFAWLPTMLRTDRAAAYLWGTGQWQRVPEAQADIEQLRVSAGGVVWALGWRRGLRELARLYGARWSVSPVAKLTGSLAMDGEEVWATTEDGVAHWDGSRWNTYRQPARVAGILAEHGQAWAIEENGTLWHFDGTVWSSEQPGRKWEDVPELARSPDGTLWMVDYGVWRREGASWREIGDLGDSTLATHGGGAWVWTGTDLVHLTGAETRQTYPAAAMGLQRGEWVNDVSESGGHLYVSTYRGILDFDGALWRRLPPLPGGAEAISGVTSAGGGTLYALGVTRHPLARRLQVLIRFVPLLLMLGVLACVVWLVRRYKRLQLSQHQDLQQAVAHATGGVPAEFARDERLLERQSSWWSAAIAVGVVVGAMAGYWVMRQFWPAAPSWMFLALALGLHLLSMLWQTLVRREQRPWDPIEPGGARFDWQPTLRSLPASLLVFFLMNSAHLPKQVGDPFVWILGAAAAFFAFKLVEQRLLQSAIHRADYDSGLAIIRRFHFYRPEGAAALLPRGHFLLLAGRYQEAEKELRRAVAALRSQLAQAHALEFLGDALLEQGREDEARRSYEASVAASPKFRRSYRGMAELALRRGGQAAQAMELIARIKGTAADDHWSLKAWALAEQGRAPEAEAAAEQALRHTNAHSKVDLAATWRRLGLAMRALNREREAAEYLAKAADIDPRGRWGTLARQALGRRDARRA